MKKRFVVVIPKDDSGVELHRMKEWLRQHPDSVPSGLDPTSSTSHQLRDGLKRLGWTGNETDFEVRLVPPGAPASGAIASVLGNGSEDLETNEPETSFALEYQLRDFIAQNLSAISVQGKRLRLYVDATGRDGVEFGPIDILAIDESGAFYIFELKRARTLACLSMR